MKKKKGFTLIELLMGVLVLALILSFTIPSVIKLLDLEKEKSDNLFAMNIKKSASLYVEEYPENVNWEDTGDGYKQVCITVKELADKGYIKKTNDKVNEFGETKKILVTMEPNQNKIYEIINEKGTCTFDSSYPNIDFENIITTTKSIDYDLICSNSNSNLAYLEYKDLNTNQFIRINVDNSKNIIQHLTFDNLKSDELLKLEAKCVNKGHKEATKSLTQSLNDISAPIIETLEKGWSKTKTVTITYNDPNNNLDHFYRMDVSGEWINVKNDSLLTKTDSNLIYKYIYDKEGEYVIQAKTTDGINNKSNSLAIGLIDTTSPTCTTSKGNGSSSGVLVTVKAIDDKSGFNETNDLIKEYPYNNVKKNTTYTVIDAAGNEGTCDVSIENRTQTRTCNTCSRCSSAGCDTYATCRDSSFGCQTYSSCRNSSCGCQTRNRCSACGCETYGGWQRGAYSCQYDRKPSDQLPAVRYSCSKSSDGLYCCTSYTHLCSTYKRCSSCSCATYKSCRNSSCGCDTYNQGTGSVCGCSVNNRSCSSCGCDSWSSWEDTTSSCSSSSSRQCSTVYY